MTLLEYTRRNSQPIRYRMDPFQLQALQRLVAMKGRVASMSPAGPDLSAILATLTPLEQALLLEILSGAML